ncbi:hypothetical protein OG741_37475 [Streptomyces sp. NBC_01410]|uniref:hypothetical protein n=1 Tax=Streptomyces sp. NBC_01410 TaxID=2903856 RepID=UPI00324BCA4C
MTTELKHVEVVDAELVDDAPAAGAVAPHDPATAAVLTALDHGAEQHLKDIRLKKTRGGYARDWALWAEFHGWLAERTNDPLPLTAVTTGTLVGFVVWLDEVKKAAPNSIDRRLTGVTVTARSMGAEVPHGGNEGCAHRAQAAQARPRAAGPRPRPGRRHHPGPDPPDEHRHCGGFRTGRRRPRSDRTPGPGHGRRCGRRCSGDRRRHPDHGEHPPVNPRFGGGAPGSTARS